MIDFDFERLAQTILTGVSDGICRGITHSRRPVEYHTYSQVKLEDLKANQSPNAYVWSVDQYKGTFLGFESGIEAEELLIVGLIQTFDGSIISVPLNQFQFTDL